MSHNEDNLYGAWTQPIEYKRLYAGGFGARENGADRVYGTADTLRGRYTDMSTNELQGVKNTAPRTEDEQIAHGVCHECCHYEELYRAATAAEAKAAAITDCVEHARETGHLNVEHELVTLPDSPFGRPRCGNCGEPVRETVADGPPPADAVHSPCGCTPTTEVFGHEH